MNTNFSHSQRGGAMIELVILMMAAAYVIHLMIHWTWQFSQSESRWAGAAHEAHRNVGHQACLESTQNVAINPNHTVDVPDHTVVVIPEGETICTPL